ncbi:MAG: biopolymer transporter ExbD [Arenicellales bacterium]|nr:biopolymer transporter ExbD [Arenicellales bacterium]
MRIHPPTENHRTEVTMVPMVNVVFLLLIFFMLVGRIAPNDSLDISLPVSSSEQAQSDELTQIVIAADGRMVLNGDELDMPALIGVVTDMVTEESTTRFELKADANLEANRLILVMEVLRQAGVQELALVTERVR